MEPIRWQETSLSLLDQRKLPLQVIWNDYTDYRDIISAIRTLEVRGAPSIGVAAAYAFCLAGLEFQNKPNFAANMKKAKEELAASRPTAVNLFWALDRMERCLDKNGAEPSCVPALIQEAKELDRENLEMNRAMSRYGAETVPMKAHILTHCNAGPIATGGIGTALGVIIEAFEQGKVEMVYVDETRPLLQGSRLTAWELQQHGVPATLICDNMAATLMNQGKIDQVLLGCDRMAANGDFANKIGTYSVAVNAHYHGVPFYTVLPSSTIDLTIADGSGIVVEQRDPQEVRTMYGVQTAPTDIPVYNPAFDVTPHKLLTGAITEKGVVYNPYKENLAKLFG
ncbi:MAG: S-methyl-5-thioribose-1-phosphate isomerase [Oscillospiraceae bacterium]|nr:S-methyl-5-thioribose-1-phosphate isomerase [Oscillospiraceae bacterium]